jgi:hypothetical protein
MMYRNRAATALCRASALSLILFAATVALWCGAIPA